MIHLYTHVFESPVGPLYLAVDRSGAAVRISYTDFSHELSDEEHEVNKYACGELEFQLNQYFAGDRRTFSVPVNMRGTPFQQTVWGRLRKLNFGETITYGALAQKIGHRNGAQAVGGAVATNPVVIVVPCHRVVPATGGIGNYAKRTLADEQGRRIKEQLLDLERAPRTV